MIYLLKFRFIFKNPTKMANRQPFSLRMHQLRGSSNGMNMSNALCEFGDNSLDANSNIFRIAIVKLSDDRYKVIFCDSGEGVNDLNRLYGIGEHVERKKNKIGVKNFGHIASVLYLSPDSVTHITKTVHDSRQSICKFNVKKVFDTIDMKIHDGNDLNYSEIDREVGDDVITTIPKRGLTDDIREELTEIIHALKNDEMKQFITNIISNCHTNFHYMSLEYKELPDNFDKDVDEAFKKLVFYYSAPVKNGFSLKYVNINDEEKTILPVNVIDLLGDESKYPRLKGSIQFMTNKKNSKTKCCVTIGYKDISENLYTEYTARSPFYCDAKSGNPKFEATRDPMWDAPIDSDYSVQKIDFECSILDEEEEDKQLGSLGLKDYGGREDLRGIATELHERIIGLPIFNPKWSGCHKRNLGGFRFKLISNDTDVAEKILGIQTMKSVQDYQSFDKNLQRVLNWIVSRVILKNYKTLDKWNIHKLSKLIQGKESDHAETTAAPMSHKAAVPTQHETVPKPKSQHETVPKPTPAAATPTPAAATSQQSQVTPLYITPKKTTVREHKRNFPVRQVSPDELFEKFKSKTDDIQKKLFMEIIKLVPREQINNLFEM
jgi:hypothetical protein